MNQDKRAKRARTKSKEQAVRKQQLSDNSRKENHIRQINLQLESCEEFVDLPTDLLRTVATRLDSGERFPGDSQTQCVAILDKVKSDLDDFKEDLGTIKEKIDTFRKAKMDSLEMTMESITICEDLEQLRTKHINLYAIDSATLNEQILDTIIPN